MAEPADSTVGVNQRVIVGKITGIHGVAGWLKVFSYTRPKENIFNYSPWLLQPDGKAISLLDGKVHGKGLIAKLEGIDDRDQARTLQGMEVAVFRDQLPEPEPGEYYWHDLLGLNVVNLNGARLGKVVELQETGANDVLVIEGERRYLVPLVMDEVIREIDLDNRQILVDWIAEEH